MVTKKIINNNTATIITGNLTYNGNSCSSSPSISCCLRNGFHLFRKQKKAPIIKAIVPIRTIKNVIAIFRPTAVSWVIPLTAKVATNEQPSVPFGTNRAHLRSEVGSKVSLPEQSPTTRVPLTRVGKLKESTPSCRFMLESELDIS
jgi:hypothetical protein